ncbi:MAG: DUF1194 domain-containing protein [Hyphomicrobiaceae bacterium]|nr:DUF1194 domain-containing protein [Hyphomicrobiaceae bacterium]
MARLLGGIFGAILLTLSPVLGAALAYADEGQVDLLLVLAADVSRSVDDKEFKLQREGYAEAMRDPRVLRAMTGGPTGRIAVIFVEWASEFEQRVLVDWAVIAGERDAQEMSHRILSAPRSYWGRTSISAAIGFSIGLLARCPFQSDRQVIDVSGDGTNNSGIEVTVARDAAVAKGITINGLVIQSDEPMPTNPSHTHPPGGLRAYYENNVIGGPGAFVLEAQNFGSFGQLIISKLIKEIAALT